MTVKIKLIPDGMPQIPQEAQDSDILASCLENSGYADWRMVERVVTGSGSCVELRLNGSLSDYTKSGLGTISESITANINGLKEHPNGWHEIESGI